MSTADLFVAGVADDSLAESGLDDAIGSTCRAAVAHVTCDDNLTFMRRYGDASMNLIVTSPPYNVGKVYERRSSLGDLSGRYETINWFTKSDDYTFNLDPIRVPPKYPGKRYFKGPNAGKLSCNPKGKNPGDVWVFPNVKNNHVEKTNHRANSPLNSLERLVLSMTNADEAVMDPYMGVGSTAVAALLHGRHAYGCDVVPEYVEISRHRIKAVRDGTIRTRPMGKPVYDPAKRNGGH